MTVENKTTNKSGSAVVANEKFNELKTESGEIGFGAGTFGEAYTEIYFSDVKAGETAYSDYSGWHCIQDSFRTGLGTICGSTGWRRHRSGKSF